MKTGLLFGPHGKSGMTNGWSNKMLVPGNSQVPSGQFQFLPYSSSFRDTRWFLTYLGELLGQIRYTLC